MNITEIEGIKGLDIGKGDIAIGTKNNDIVVKLENGFIFEYSENEIKEIYQITIDVNQIPVQPKKISLGKDYDGDHYVNTSDGIIVYTNNEMNELEYTF